MFLGNAKSELFRSQFGQGCMQMREREQDRETTKIFAGYRYVLLCCSYLSARVEQANSNGVLVFSGRTIAVAVLASSSL